MSGGLPRWLSFLVLSGLTFLLLRTWPIERSSESALLTQAEQLARLADTYLKQARKLYTHDIIRKLQSEFPGQIKGSVRFDRPGEIPIPDVFVRLLAQSALTIDGDVVFARRSEWSVNPEQEIPHSTSDFERRGWNFLLEQQEKLRKQAGGNPAEYMRLLQEYSWRPFTRVEGRGDQAVFRTMIAEPAADRACVNCHNGLEQMPEIVARRRQVGLAGKVWQQNEILGAVSIKVPLARLAGFTSAKGTNLLSMALLSVLLALAAVGLFRSTPPNQ